MFHGLRGVFSAQILSCHHSLLRIALIIIANSGVPIERQILEPELETAKGRASVANKKSPI